MTEAFRLYGKSDCTGLDRMIQHIDFAGSRVEYRAPINLLQAYCAEIRGEILSAKDHYAALIAEGPRTAIAVEAAMRLRDLERLEKQAVTRAELTERVGRERETPLYQHGIRSKSSVSPAYPSGPRSAGVEGWVEIDFEISRDGAVVDPVVIASDPPFLFEGAALGAIKNWVYPAHDPTQPMRSIARINFQLEHEAPPSVRVATREDLSELDPLEKRGRELYENDLAADRAGDAVVRTGYFTSLWNWIVVPHEHGSLVRYINDQDKVFADVVVDIYSTDPEKVTIHDVPVALSPSESETWKARVSALALSRERAVKICTQSYSWVILPSLDPSRSWDVYFLATSMDPRVVPIGGHYRIRVSRDPGVAPDLHAFAESCTSQTASSGSEMLAIDDPVSKAPTELHVFLNLRYGHPLSVAVHDDQNGLWYVEQGRISRSGAPTR